MRIPALSTVLLIAVLGGPAHAERRKTDAPGHDAAAVGMRMRAEQFAASLTAKLAITGPSHVESQPVAANTVATNTVAARPAIAISDDLGGALRKATPRRAAFLTAGDITAQVAPHASDIEQCYLDGVGEARLGARLDLTFAIARDGSVLSLRATAPGIPAKMMHRIETCIRATVEAVQFPERRNDTTAVVPYVFQRTEAPDAGPQLSCWNPQGC